MSPDGLFDAVDPFAGPGGWSVACKRLGVRELGLEVDDAACRTRYAAGHATWQVDVTTVDPRMFRGVPGLIMSPPCPDFSAAGKRAGRTGESGRLIELVPQWVKLMEPEWVACEQVPEALAIWREFAHEFRGWGYSAWTGVLEAERYGVPQTRERAILMAHRSKPVQPPEPTHQRYVPGEPQGAGCEPSLLGPGLLPWVSMADALGWGQTIPAWTLAAGTKNGGADVAMMGGSGTRNAVNQRRQTGDWVVDRRTNSKGPGGSQVPSVPVPMSSPSPTLTAKAGGQWCFYRPTTTVCGDPRLGAPGHRDREGGEPQFGEGSVKLTVEEAAVLQSFPADYPWQGTKTKKFEQIGNAVPPGLAEPIVAALVGGL